MAADVGSMFQYWKKFDLRRLQVSDILTFLALFLPAVRLLAACRRALSHFWVHVKRKLAAFALIVIRN